MRRVTFVFLATALSTAGAAFVSPRGPPLTPPPSQVPSKGFIKDAELKHGRVALVSGAVLAALSSAGVAHPTAALATMPLQDQLLFFSAIGVAEAATYLPRLDGMFSLKDTVFPGRLLPWASPTTGAREFELNTCRAVMLLVFAYMVADAIAAAAP